MLAKKLMEIFSYKKSLIIGLLIFVSFNSTILSACDFTILDHKIKLDYFIPTDTYLVYNHKKNRLQIYKILFDSELQYNEFALMYRLRQEKPLHKKEFLKELEQFCLFQPYFYTEEDWQWILQSEQDQTSIY